MSSVKELEEKVKELMNEIETLKQEKKNEEFEYPFEEDEPYWAVKDEGYVQWLKWDNECYDKPRYEQGHIFKTEQEAERECNRRILLTKFRQFRDKCNGDWKPQLRELKYYIFLNCTDFNCSVSYDTVCNAFNLFGYFKHKTDCKRAIELFGDEIKRLWVEE